MAEFIIVFREVLEASLVVGIIYLLIEKTNQPSHFSKLWSGVFASILASIAVGFIVIQAKNILGNNSTQALFEAIFLYLTAFLIWYVIFWLSKNVSDKKVLEGKTLQAMELSSMGVFFVVFFIISTYPLINGDELRLWSLIISISFLLLGLERLCMKNFHYLLSLFCLCL